MEVIHSVLRRLAAGRRACREKCTAQTVGFIRDVHRTGEKAGEFSRVRIQVDALDEEGKLFSTSIQKMVSWTQLVLLTPGAALPIRYNPENKELAVSDCYPDERHIQELLDRYECGRHPEGTPLAKRREINRNGVMKKAVLENLRLTGRVEDGEQEAEITVRFFREDRETDTARRRMYLNDRLLENLIVGNYVDIRIVPENKNLFAFVVPANFICPR